MYSAVIDREDIMKLVQYDKRKGRYFHSSKAEIIEVIQLTRLKTTAARIEKLGRKLMKGMLHFVEKDEAVW